MNFFAACGGWITNLLKRPISYRILKLQGKCSYTLKNRLSLSSKNSEELISPHNYVQLGYTNENDFSSNYAEIVPQGVTRYHRDFLRITAAKKLILNLKDTLFAGSNGDLQNTKSIEHEINNLLDKLQKLYTRIRP